MVHHDPDQPPPMVVYVHRFGGFGAFIGLGLATALALAGAPGEAAIGAYFATVLAGGAVGEVVGRRAHRTWRNQ